MRTRALLAAALLTVAGCSDAGTGDRADHVVADSPAPVTGTVGTSEDPEPLPIGKDDLELDRAFLTPEGFSPPMVVDLGASGMTWTSVHRGADGFDLGQPNPDADAPLVAVAFLVPAESSSKEALSAVRQRATDAGATVRDADGRFGELAREGIEITDGDEEVVASRDGDIALDAVPGGRLQVWAADSAAPMLVVVFAPDAQVWPQALDASQRLAGAILWS